MDSNAGAAEGVIMQLCRAWTDAIRDRDDATMDGVMADDFPFTDERGRWDKTRFIENTRRWDLVGMDFHDVLVRDYGEVVMMQARVALHARLDGREMSGEWHLTDVWVRRGEEWQVVARQWSRSNPSDAPPAAR